MTKKKEPVVEQTNPVQDIEQTNPEMVKEPGLDPVIKQAAGNVFASHTNDKLYFTSDKSCFTELYQAEAHSVSLEDKTIITVKREEI